jgi:hypothetical protein
MYYYITIYIIHTYMYTYRTSPHYTISAFSSYIATSQLRYMYLVNYLLLLSLQVRYHSSSIPFPAPRYMYTRRIYYTRGLHIHRYPYPNSYPSLPPSMMYVKLLYRGDKSKKKRTRRNPPPPPLQIADQMRP